MDDVLAQLRLGLEDMMLPLQDERSTKVAELLFQRLAVLPLFPPTRRFGGRCSRRSSSSISIGNTSSPSPELSEAGEPRFLAKDTVLSPCRSTATWTRSTAEIVVRGETGSELRSARRGRGVEELCIEGLAGENTVEQVMRAVTQGVVPMATPTNWELAQLYVAGRLKDVTFVDRIGTELANPFK
jgi:hypothetical protein